MPKTFKSPIKIKILAVGGAGCNYLERLVTLDSQGIERIAVSIPGKVINRLKGVEKIILSAPTTAQKEDGDFGRNLAAGSRSKIIEAVRGADIVFILGSLSKDFNIGIMEEVTSVVKNEGIISFLITTNPFSFEGKGKAGTAKTAHKRLSGLADAVITIDSDKLLGQDLTAKKGLSAPDFIVYSYISALVEALDRCGEINADFNDFKTTIAGCGQAFLGIGSASRSKLEEAVSRATTNPYLENDFEGAQRVLYVITAGADLAMNEVRQIGEAIKAKAADDVRIIFSVVKDQEMGDKVKIVILAGGVNVKELTANLFSKKQAEIKSAVCA